MTEPLNPSPSKTTIAGIVEQIIQEDPSGAEQAQIAIPGADALLSEIRIENTLTTRDGDEVSLKRGAPVEITIKA